MKKLNLICVFALAALLFAGCEMSKEPVSSVKGEATVVATRDGAFTRSVLDAKDGSYEVLWSAPDKIYVGYAGVKPAVFTSTNTSKAASATFKGTLPDGEGMLCGIYPAKDNNSIDSDGTFSVLFHEEQNAVGGSYDPNAFPSVAMSENNNLSFLNVCGLLELSVGYSDVTKITLINGIEEPLPPIEEEHPATRFAAVSIMPSGTLSVVLEDGEPFIDDFTGSSSEIVLKAPSGGYFSKDEVYYMVVPPCDFPDGAMFVLDRASGTPVTINFYNVPSVERSKVYPVGTLFDEEIPDDNVPEEPIDEPGDDATDLSEDGTANCYVVYSAGEYKFKTVKGNSSASVGSVVEAEILWETHNDAEEVEENSVILDCSVDEGGEYIRFKTPEKIQPGNALIAALDATGNILWSWHIWIPATEITTDTYGLSTKHLMDRYLGALGTELSTGIGLGYQWGRKDPFPGPKSKSSGTPMGYSGTIRVDHGEDPDPENDDNTLPIGTVSLSIANPTTIYNANNNDWNTTTDDGLWSSSKTIYDPCPAGYKVPSVSEAEGLFAENLSTADGWESADDKTWFKVGSPATLFPVCGYLDDYSYDFKYSKVGARVAILSADGNGAKVSIINMRLDKDSGYRGLGTCAKSRLGFIRCIAE